ncbi:hypothetical protein FOE78_19560 [Microlunatus elymi]|uniref:DUF5596 domain-containing protein n=1 Tax=Microlunatus elymi TaxID=2596828 RepID=A0A516Q3M0_9ACTN|nr:acyltransferase domain-containing protein [Microlunatus elymi]QDP97811.1 hypothetical protein FOE78_19560 [Microlunatus elymi]
MSTTVTSSRLAGFDEAALARFGFTEEDRRDARRVIERVIDDPDAIGQVERMAEALRAGVGAFDNPTDPYAVIEAAVRERADRQWGVGVLPMLALLASAEEVAAFHAGRGIDPEISRASLADLGQQAWVHRRTFDAFGLHTYGWMRVAWSGALYWLGRLQFNLTRWGADDGGDWVISTHIPESGPLTPEAVADSFGRARIFFARHFGDYPTRLFHCNSWLLDPQLVEVLPGTSNMVRFQQLWQLRGEGHQADGDAIFFVFRRRGEVDHESLPQDTTLQREIVAKLADGGHWYCWHGVIDQDQFPPVEPARTAQVEVGQA